MIIIYSRMAPSYSCLRQNPYTTTNQQRMRKFIISHNIVTCPFGHSFEARDNVVNGKYNEQNSNSQDRKFIEDMKPGDFVLIPFAKEKKCILAEIVSDPFLVWDTGLFTIMLDGKFKLSRKGIIPFRPVGRKIRIIRDDIVFDDKRVLPRNSLSLINPQIISQFLN